MAMLRTLINLAATAMLIKLAMAANYTVGGQNGGWDSSTNLQTWVDSQSFLVGDNLIFQYTANHDVLEVTKADHDSCQGSNPIQSYSDGNTIIPLSNPGKRYFICGTIGHCGQGMKVEIDTLATSAPPPASPATPPAASPITPPTSSPSPKTSPTPSPAHSPKSAPPMSSPSPSNSPSSSPTSPPDVPSTESPTTSTPPSGSLVPPPPSSANKVSFQASLAMGFALMMLLAL